MERIPPLRPLEAIKIDEGGEPMVLLTDPAGYSPQSVTLSMSAFSIVTLMTTEQSVQELLDATERQFGFRPDENDVAPFIKSLDDAFMLQSARFIERRDRERREFLAQPSRPAVFAGQSYPDDPQELAGRMFELFIEASTRPDKSVRGLAVPHIDFSIGADLMAEGWKTIQGTDADLVIILGTGHTLADDFFACLDKDYETPLGAMPVDTAFLTALEENFGEDIYRQAEAHRREHSIEFASLFFAHLFKKRPDVTAVPILLSFPEMIHSLEHPLFSGERIDRFVTALRKTIVASGRKVVFVASVDFSHIGARFGDDGELRKERLAEVQAADMSLIEAVTQCDSDRFLKEAQEVNHDNRVCGFPPLYILQKVADLTSGELLGYRQNIEGDNASMVSFATLAMR